MEGYLSFLAFCVYGFRFRILRHQPHQKFTPRAATAENSWSPLAFSITSIIYSKNKIFTWLSKLGTSSLSLVDTKLGNQSCNIARIGSLSFSSNFSLIRSALISSRLALQHLSLEGFGW